MTTQLERPQISAEQVADILNITYLVYDYCHGLDTRDSARFMSIWADDATWEFDHPMIGRHAGREAIEAIVTMFWAGFPRLHHLSSNVRVTVDGDSASAIWDAWAVFETAAGTTTQLNSRYTDEFARVGGRWVTTSRFVTLDPQIDFAA